MSYTTRSLVNHSFKPADLALFNRLDQHRYPVLLSSTARGQHATQYDILPAFPQSSLCLYAGHKLIHRTPGEPDKVSHGAFLDTFESIYQAESLAQNNSKASSDTVPYTGGWFVYLSYEMAAEIESCLDLPVNTTEPLAVACRCPCAIIHDISTGSVYALAEAGFEHLLDEIEHDFRKVMVQAADYTLPRIEITGLTEGDESEYFQQVEKIKQYIVDGDIFQANLSRLWTGFIKHDITDADLFRRLAEANPSSFAALVTLPEMSIISSSPERLVSSRQGIVETRPIAGTRSRYLDASQDRAIRDELIRHPKERAEHIMLIDLERNDLGRVCKTGTIEVNELMVTESWEHVHHIVSNIRGHLSDAKTPVDVLKAVFPGGTITGCPKIRCIEILAELEQQARGPYTGSLGYINRDGSMDFNILIRTLVRQGGQIRFRAGGGIVSDSVDIAELEETRAKARGLLKIFDNIPDQSGHH